ncbi:hypothetical protein SUDANB140_02437 [Streptomyces sp. enrichment culture]
MGTTEADRLRSRQSGIRSRTTAQLYARVHCLGRVVRDGMRRWRTSAIRHRGHKGRDMTIPRAGRPRPAAVFARRAGPRDAPETGSGRLRHTGRRPYASARQTVRVGATGRTSTHDRPHAYVRQDGTAGRPAGTARLGDEQGRRGWTARQCGEQGRRGWTARQGRRGTGVRGGAAGRSCRAPRPLLSPPGVRPAPPARVGLRPRPATTGAAPRRTRRVPGLRPPSTRYARRPPDAPATRAACAGPVAPP